MGTNTEELNLEEIKCILKSIILEKSFRYSSTDMKNLTGYIKDLNWKQCGNRQYINIKNRDCIRSWLEKYD
jgi:hypothetical protein